MLSLLIFSLAAVYAVTTVQGHIYGFPFHRLEFISQKNGASCLDGTPPAYYIHEGTTNKDKFIIAFSGGEFCAGMTTEQIIKSCYERSLTKLGSSSFASKYSDFSENGVMSPDQQANPLFYDWTKIFVLYCDGTEYLGNINEPVDYQGHKIYFRGGKNVIEIFNHLSQHYDFYNKDTIVITGVSAGGMASFQWSNYLYEHTVTSKVLAMPDSGLFLIDYFSPVVQARIIQLLAKFMIELAFDPQYVPQFMAQCMGNPNYKKTDCLNAGNYAHKLKAPTLIIQSLYDEYSLQIFYLSQCLTNAQHPFSLQNCDKQSLQFIEDFRQANWQKLQTLRGNSTNLGVWAPACIQHGFTRDSTLTNQNYSADGVTLLEAIRLFIENPDSPPWLIDSDPWPNNAGCSGIQPFS